MAKRLEVSWHKKAQENIWMTESHVPKKPSCACPGQSIEYSEMFSSANV